MAQSTLRFMFIGDLVGDPGITLFKHWAPKLKERYKADAIIVNGENSAKNGLGITPQIIDELKKAGANVITTGNHAWDHKEVYQALNERDDIIRPVNYPPQCPGKGYTFFTVADQTVAVVNLHGRVFVKDSLDCPFRAIKSLLLLLKTKTNIIFVDFHAEATSEKTIMGMFLDGQVTGVYGTHTHVQTADEHILPKGTSYITDLGACRALNSAIGMEYESLLNRLLIHHKFGKITVEKKGPYVLSGVYVDVDVATGKALAIQRIYLVDNDLPATVPK